MLNTWIDSGKLKREDLFLTTKLPPTGKCVDKRPKSKQLFTDAWPSFTICATCLFKSTEIVCLFYFSHTHHLSSYKPFNSFFLFIRFQMHMHCIYRQSRKFRWEMLKKFVGRFTIVLCWPLFDSCAIRRAGDRRWIFTRTKWRY